MENPNTTAQNMIFQKMRDTFGEKWYSSVTNSQWTIWRHHINTQLFNNDIIAPEAINVIGSIDKKQWPIGTGFISRVRDSVLLNRRNKPLVVEKSRRMEGLGDIIHRLG